MDEFNDWKVERFPLEEPRRVGLLARIAIGMLILGASILFSAWITGLESGQ